MLKKIGFFQFVMLLVAIACLVWLISNPEMFKPRSSPAGIEPVAVAPEAFQVRIPTNLSGEWISKEPRMIAVIDDGTIRIDMVGDDFSMGYWYGSFKMPNGDGDTIVSNAIEGNGLVLSLSTKKEFVYKDGALSFELTAMGVTNTVELTRK
jgi:hypothetical protein